MLFNKKINLYLFFTIFLISTTACYPVNLFKIIKNSFQKKFTQTIPTQNYKNPITTKIKYKQELFINSEGEIDFTVTNKKIPYIYGVPLKNWEKQMRHLDEPVYNLEPKTEPQNIETGYYKSAAQEFKKTPKYNFIHKTIGIPEAENQHYNRAEKIIGKSRFDFDSNNVQKIDTELNKRINSDLSLKKVEREFVNHLKKNNYYEAIKKCFEQEDKTQCTKNTTKIFMDTTTELYKTLWKQGEKNILHKIYYASLSAGHPRHAKKSKIKPKESLDEKYTKNI